ncbi:helix-turn-helix domain-containing protein [Allosalinactinospora lopnorensis]|uniref:helix-turn-helix domain-containing protein n=1 Tax=Allosalinactinospora lopnorensis TaxID=1352348 RepID=UPI000697F109|nr:helix-turn-helix domain-containing protein [Allosalinactinospora lopnorensis]
MSSVTELRALRDTCASHWGAFFESSGEEPASSLPQEIRDSWARTRASAAPLATVAAAHLPATSDAGFALCRVARHLEPRIRALSMESGYLIAIADPTGTLIHTSAGREMLRRAERVNAVPQSAWGERVMGTNALSLALRTGRPAQVFATQHAAQTLHDWTCWAVPIRARDSGALGGVVNIAAPWNHHVPMGAALARSVALMVEDAQDILTLSGSGERPHLVIRLLGPSEVVLRGASVPLSPRQMEIVAILAMRPGGVSPDELHSHLYGDRRVAATTLRVELSKLRSLLGGDVLLSPPYRLNAEVDLDLSRALAHLAAGETHKVLDLLRGEPLPWSDSPYLREMCTYVCVALRNRLLLTGCAGDALRYAEIFPWDDEVLRTAMARTPRQDPRTPLLMGRLAASASPAPTLRQHLGRTVSAQDCNVLSW